MALRFNKRIKIAPGIKLNVGLKGVSTTLGGRGASVNIGKKGTYANLGIPGTGISSRTKISGRNTSSKQVATSPKRAPSTNTEKFFMGLGAIVWAVAIIAFFVWLFG